MPNPRGRPKKVKEPLLATAQPAPLSVPTGTSDKYDEYGVCISCKGGKEGCLHNNLTQNGQNLTCVTCGLCIK